jgi:hypothetical protein
MSTIRNKVPEANDDFWSIISKSQWDGDVDATEKRLFGALSESGIEPHSFRATYHKVIDVINEETNLRIENGDSSFESRVNYGGDGCHFIYLPGELTARGEEEVNRYLDGALVPFEAREAFSYIFQVLDE